MNIVEHESAAAILDHAHEHLCEHEALNNHLLGVLGNAVAGAYDAGDNLWMTAVSEDDVVGCALRTSPWPLGISFGTTALAAAALAERAASKVPEGFDLNVSPHIAAAIRDRAGWDLEEIVGQGIYELNKVQFPDGVPGSLRPALEWDVDLCTQWAVGFQNDTNLPMQHSMSRLRQMIRDFIAQRSLAIWEVDGTPVSMAAARGATPRGIRISLVYTPAERRRNGFASACVAALSQQQLDAGRELVFLFTELSNATSNHIYQAIGFRRVGSLSTYRRLT